MINDFIKQIVELNNNAKVELNKINEEVSNIDEKTTREIRLKESSSINNLTNELEESLESKLQEAELNKEAIIRETQRSYEQLNERYDLIKVKLANEVVQLLLENS